MKTSFSASNFFTHIFNISVTYPQSVEKIQWKLQEELISESVHYQPLFTRCNCQKMVKLKTVSLSKNIFSASNFFKHIYNISVIYLQSIEKI